MEGGGRFELNAAEHCSALDLLSSSGMECPSNSSPAYMSNQNF